MTVVLHPVDLQHLAGAPWTDIPDHITLVPLSAQAQSPAAPDPWVLAPADDRELAALWPTLASHPGHVVVLLGGPEVLRVHDDAWEPTPGRGEILVDGEPGGVCVLACGAQVGEALAATMDLHTQTIRPRIASLTSLRPLDEALVRRCSREASVLLVAEAPLPTGLPSLAESVTALLPHQPPPIRITAASPARQDDEALTHPFGPTARDIRVAVTRAARRSR